MSETRRPYYLMCGDCLEKMRNIPDKSVHMILCDLPYGITQNVWDKTLPLDMLWTQYKRICTGTIVLTAAQPFTSMLVLSNPKMFRYEWVWDKVNESSGFFNANRRPLIKHEIVLVFSERAPEYFPQKSQGAPYIRKRNEADDSGENYNSVTKRTDSASNERFPESILRVPIQDNAKRMHPTQKPVALMEYLIKTYTLPGMVVLDNCMGSGTTGVAAAQTGRRFIGMELDPNYFRIAKERIDDAYAKSMSVTET